MKKLFKLGLFVAIVAGVSKVIATKKEEWTGLTEAEVRTKLSDKLGERMPPEKLTEVQDKVVGAMRDRGKLAEDEATAAAAETPATEEAAPEEE